jgi:hypothetical protein
LYRILGVELLPPYQIELEWAPKPAEKYLGDRTSFDTYIKVDIDSALSGLLYPNRAS